MARKVTMSLANFRLTQNLTRGRLLMLRVFCCVAIGVLSLGIIVLHEVAPQLSGLLDLMLATYILNHFLGFKSGSVVCDNDEELRAKILKAVESRNR
jgi:hypothetical protein